jgi:hypothetical protein
MRDVVDDLAAPLFELDTAGLGTAAVTSLITAEIVRWAHGNGWVVRTEARVHAVSSQESAARSGFVDVIVRRGSGDPPDLAIEIDSGDKPWSVEKLRHAAQAGMRAIWVRWGDNEWAGIYDDVDVIQLRALRRPRRRSVDAQLSLWR